MGEPREIEALSISRIDKNGALWQDPPMTFRSPIFELSHTYIDDAAALSPMDCTYLGNGLNQDKLDDFSISWRCEVC
jgi:hypothetical protein